MNNRPKSEEYNTHFDQYIRIVPEGAIEELLTNNLFATIAILEETSEQQGNYRYAPSKWSLKEVLGHINDCERIMSYRLLRIARGDTTPLAGFDQDVLVHGANFDSHTVTQLLEEFTILRKATLALIRGLTDEAWTRKGTVSGNTMSVKALAYIIAGHELHHIGIIKERYLE